ncbi:MAG: hypothetical protein ACFFDI_25055 [Promethearchaeota archaeon]
MDKAVEAIVKVLSPGMLVDKGYDNPYELWEDECYLFLTKHFKERLAKTILSLPEVAEYYNKGE